MKTKRFNTRKWASLCLILVCSISFLLTYGPTPSYSGPCPKMQAGYGQRVHPMNTSFHGQLTSAENGFDEESQFSTTEKVTYTILFVLVFLLVLFKQKLFRLRSDLHM